MSGDLASFYTALINAEKSAFIATPPVFRMADSFGFAGDEFQSSASLSFDQPVTELDIIDLENVLAGPNQRLQQEIMGILMSDYGQDQDELAQFQSQEIKQDQVQKAIERHTSRIESYLRSIAKTKAEVNHEREKTEQLKKLESSEFASSQGTSQSKQDSMRQITDAYLIGPNDVIGHA